MEVKIRCKINDSVEFSNWHFYIGVGDSLLFFIQVFLRGYIIWSRSLALRCRWCKFYRLSYLGSTLEPGHTLLYSIQGTTPRENSRSVGCRDSLSQV